MTFKALFERYSWKQIHGCPGRYILKKENPAFNPEDYTHAGKRKHVFHVSKAPDPVHVVQLEDGGLISFEKKEGTYIHTLNDHGGFQRKLNMLGITLDES